MLFAEGLNHDDLLYDSDLDPNGEPRQIQTEPFEFADESIIAQDKIEDEE